MKGSRLFAALCVAALVVGCGGGGGKGSAAPQTPAPMPPPPPPPPPPVADVKLTLSTEPVSAEISHLDDFGVTLKGTWTGANLGTLQVYLQATDSASKFVMPAVALAPADGNYSFTVPLAATVGPGTHAGTFTVRACQDVQCVTPYAGSTQTLAYSVKVNSIAEWETLQRNASHNGYMPIRLDTAKFTKAWEWESASSSSYSTSLSPVVTWDKKVFISEQQYGSPWLYALNETNGSVTWKQQFTFSWSAALNAPATSDGKVYVTTTGHENTFLWAFNAADGTAVLQTRFSTQWANILAPTVKDGKAYVNAGYYGGVVYAYNANTGVSLWSKSGGTYGMNTPAVDDKHVYSHNSVSLQVHDIATGDEVATIGGSSGGIQTDYNAAPVIGADDHVIAYKGSSYSYSYGSQAQRPLVSYSVSDRAVRWQSEKNYGTYPAVAKGVIYVASDNPKSLDALDEKTGKVLWSWVPGTADTTFQGNVVVTDNLVFVSTNRALHALDLTTRKPVWESTTPGSVAISANRTLFVVTRSSSTSRGKLVAFRTR